MPEKITFFESYYEAASCLDETERLKFYDAIFEYAFSGVEPGFTGGMAVAWKLVKPNLDKSIERSTSGRKGADKTNNQASQTATSTADADSRNGCLKEPERLNEIADTAVENSLPRIRSMDKEKDRDKENGQGKGKGVGTVLVQDQNQNRPVPRSQGRKRGGNGGALPKCAPQTANPDGDVEFEDHDVGAGSGIDVVNTQLSEARATLNHDPTNTFAAREVKRLSIRLETLNRMEQDVERLTPRLGVLQAEEG